MEDGENAYLFVPLNHEITLGQKNEKSREATVTNEEIAKYFSVKVGKEGTVVTPTAVDIIPGDEGNEDSYSVLKLTFELPTSTDAGIQTRDAENNVLSYSLGDELTISYTDSKAQSNDRQGGLMYKTVQIADLAEITYSEDATAVKEVIKEGTKIKTADGYVYEVLTTSKSGSTIEKVATQDDSNRKW